jgi:SAM-dependent methyltransferase
MVDIYIKENKESVSNPQFWANRIKEFRGAVDFSIYTGRLSEITITHKTIINNFIKSNDNVIDIGCGYGRMAPLFKYYLGIDFSPEYISIAKDKYPEKDFILVDDFFNFNTNKKYDWALLVGIGNMVKNYAPDKWDSFIKGIKSYANRILILEMDEPDKYEIL